ncbi:hypothetical protein Tco_0249137, partial [Tanacetum coccineum]
NESVDSSDVSGWEVPPTPDMGKTSVLPRLDVTASASVYTGASAAQELAKKNNVKYRYRKNQRKMASTNIPRHGNMGGNVRWKEAPNVREPSGRDCLRLASDFPPVPEAR